MPLKLATWNINSVRLRLGLVQQFLGQQLPDVLCLQEIKCKEPEFPYDAFKALGYAHLAVNGQKGYHGVAIASRIPFTVLHRREFCQKGDSRHISVRFETGEFSSRGLRVHNMYVPAGGDEPDPIANSKFAHKLAFYDEMKTWFEEESSFRSDSILVGDLNVAPLATDVWNHRAMLKVVSHTPIEVEKFTAAFNAGNWTDGLRKHIPPEQKLYTWWSYRSPNWELADKGRRLDHIWLSPQVAEKSTDVSVLKEARGWARPSDHVPVTIRLR